MAVVARARIPIDPVQRDIICGLGVWGAIAAVGAITMTGYIFSAIGLNLVVGYWAFKAWRPEPPTNLTRRALETFQPWRIRRIAQ